MRGREARVGLRKSKKSAQCGFGYGWSGRWVTAVSVYTKQSQSSKIVRGLVEGMCGRASWPREEIRRLEGQERAPVERYVPSI